MRNASLYTLKSPETGPEWKSFHEIRRKILFENRGIFGVYDANHPDDHSEGNHPLILAYRDDVIGVMRVDILGKDAVFRRVAIREDIQRCGHGQVMLSLAEEFVREKGCSFIRSFVNPEAVGFYRRCGFAMDDLSTGDGKSVPMCKQLL